jgi:HlyD family secretion protein
MVTPGMPILRLSRLNTVWLRVYVPEQLVEKVKIGQRARVATDAGATYQGTVVEIAEEPEFTPKNVQTKEERVKLVFGVKIEVDNPEGTLKPGMPADAVIDVK